ncbi:MAG: gluconate 2-dehydrogenase subunit 3 family protein [Acidobacteria bacterium]|nr:gluconate 2-dehydrogenase subunit 3 family protein [Acidobacteriota bacterium]
MIYAMDQIEDRKNPGRRRFLTSAAVAAAAGSGAGCGRANSSWRFFSEEEGDTLMALCEQFIPGDQDAGAGWARTAYFIDRQMFLRYRELRGVYGQGLLALDGFSRARFQRRFVELPAGDQTALLTEFEKREPAFFNLVLLHTMQGFYGNPRHGGNRDAVSWRMLGVPEPPVRGRRKG